MKPALSLLGLILLLPLTRVSSAQPEAELSRTGAPSSSHLLTELAKSHEAVFQSLTGSAVSIVLQKGDKQFTVYGVTGVRAVGCVIEITVKTGAKYSVAAGDVFFITSDAFKI